MDIYTLYENVSYEFDEGKKSLFVRWDDFNVEVNDLIIKEMDYMYDKNTFTNLSFIDEFKEHIHWEEGQTIHINISYSLTQIFRGEITIKILEDAYHEHYTFLEVNGDGYLYLREFQGNCIANTCETEFTTHKINCYYNELVYERENLVILK